MLVDLYGRAPNSDGRATFNYPLPSDWPIKRAKPIFMTLPAAANRIFGDPDLRMLDGDDVTVRLDPSSTYEYTQRWKGLGRMGGDPVPPAPGTVRHFSSDFFQYAADHPTAMYIGVGALVLIALGGFKVLGRLGM